jgi:hypothetical protein
MNNTPETKAFKTRIRGIDGDKHWVPAGFAEILERERDEARKSLDKMSKYLAQVTVERDHAETELRKMIDFSKSALGERDEARKRLKEIEEYGADEINTAVDLRQKLATALVERDLAMKVLKRLEGQLAQKEQ